MMKYVAAELRESVSRARIDAVMHFGFTERQARFFVHVLVFSGVFIERQYRAFTGLAQGPAAPCVSLPGNPRGAD